MGRTDAAAGSGVARGSGGTVCFPLGDGAGVAGGDQSLAHPVRGIGDAPVKHFGAGGFAITDSVHFARTLVLPCPLSNGLVAAAGGVAPADTRKIAEEVPAGRTVDYGGWTWWRVVWDAIISGMGPAGVMDGFFFGMAAVGAVFS